MGWPAGLLVDACFLIHERHGDEVMASWRRPKVMGAVRSGCGLLSARIQRTGERDGGEVEYGGW